MTVATSSLSTASARLVRPLAVVAGAVLIAPTLLRPGSHGPVLCPLRRITGVWCPTCGMTRALGWLAHGDLRESLRYHPLASLLLIEGALVAAYLLYRRQKRSAGPLGPLSSRSVGPLGPLSSRSDGLLSTTLVRGLLVANALLLLVVWLVRLSSGSFDSLG